MPGLIPPILFEPILKPRVWGGRGLEKLGRVLPPGEAIGESWEIADLPESVPEGRSIIAGGPLDGLTLRQAIEHAGESIMGDAVLSDDGGFPLLIKYLDARENLSVQVHPDEAYVAEHPDTHLKSEAWFIVDAEPGAVIYKGIKPGVSAEALAQHARDRRIVDDLVALPVRPGDCHYLPSGTCHALGAGIVVAEVQTPSDTTFRLYDWGRTDRPVHIEQALQCVRLDAIRAEAATRVEPMIDSGGLASEVLVDCDYFSIDHRTAYRSTELSIVTSNRPLIWMMLRGEAQLHGEGHPAVPVHGGTTVLIPAIQEGMSAKLLEGAEVLEVRPPSPSKGMLA